MRVQFRKGWTPDRRALQSAAIRRAKPWQRSTGPKTETGKARCALNALKHGERSAATILLFRRVRRALRLAAWNIERLRAHIRARIPGSSTKFGTNAVDRNCCGPSLLVSINRPHRGEVEPA